MNRPVLLDNYGWSLAEYQNYKNHRNDDEELVLQRQKILKALNRAIEEDLTPRQNEMVKLYYFENLKMEDIAKTLSVNKSTVCRTLQRARQQIARSLKYLLQ